MEKRSKDHLDLPLLISIVFVGLFLSFISLYKKPVFNGDALYYFHQAEFCLKYGFGAFLSQHNWHISVYPILIAYLSKWFFLSLVNATYLLNILIDLLSGVCFLFVVKRMGGTQRILWIALLLFALYLPLNVYRADIVRGHGYWLFYLLSINCFIIFFEKRTFLSAFLWGLSIIAGALFRMEALLFLLFTPFIIFFLKEVSWCERIKGFSYLLLPLVVILLFAVGLFVHSADQLFTLLAQFWHAFIAPISQMDYWLHKNVLMSLVDSTDRSLFLIGGLLFIYIYNALQAVTLLGFILFCFSLFSTLISTNARRVLFGYIIVNLFLTVPYLVQEQGFISSRYLFTLGLTFLCFAPFGFELLFQKFLLSRSKHGFIAITFYMATFLLIVAVVSSVFHFGHSNRFISNAAKWVKGVSDKTAKVYSNDPTLAYMLDRNTTGYHQARADLFSVKLLASSWKQYDFIVLELDNTQFPKVRQFQQVTGLKPVNIFYNKHKSSAVFIFSKKTF